MAPMGLFSGRRLLPTSIHARAFLLVTLIEALVDISLEAAVIVQTDLIDSLLSSSRTPLAVYLALFIFAHLWQLALAWDALGVRNTIQVVGLCVFNAAFLLYAFIQVSEIRQIQDSSNNTRVLQTALVVIPILIAVSQVAFIYLTWYIYREFGWDVYKQIGADRRVKRMYMWYQIFICLLKFDYFFFIAFCLQLVLLVPSVVGAEKYLTIAAVPMVLVLLVGGYLGVRKELRWLSWGFLGGCLAGAGYFVYKLFRIWEGRRNPSTYGAVFKTLTVFSVLCFLMLLGTMSCAAKCLLNFNRGLKNQMDKKSHSRKEAEALDGMGMHFNLSSAAGSRLSID